MKQSTTFASVANKFSKVLQGYTKGIRVVAVLTMLLTMGIGQAWADATLTFDNTSKRTTFTTSQQVWTENGVTCTNNKYSSTNNVADYANPARFYANSNLVVEYSSAFNKIVFDCNNSSYATATKNSIETINDATVSVSSDKVTVTFSNPITSFTIAKFTAQVRMDAITVTPSTWELRGSFDNWGNGVEMTEVSTGKATATLELAANTQYEFKFLNGSNWLGNSGTINADISNWVFKTTESSNVKLNSGLGGTFTFTIDYSASITQPKVSVTYPRKDIYMACGDSWCDATPTFFAHAWRNGGSETYDVKLVQAPCESSVYIAENIPAYCSHVIFTRQKPGSTKLEWNGANFWNQSEDITISTNDLFTCTGWNNNKGIFSGSSYTPPTYKITFSGNGNTGGSMSNVTGIPCEGSTTLATNGYTRTGYTFNGWKDTDGNAFADKATISNIKSNITLTAQWKANTNTPYKVKHYKQQLDGTYSTTPDETENCTGTTAASVTPTVKSYSGFKAPSTQTVTIAADGSTVVEYKYTRNSYTLTWNLDGGTITTGGTPAGSVKYGAALKVPTVTKNGYQFDIWNPSVPATMPAADATYTAKWKKLYTVTWMVNGVEQESQTDVAGTNLTKPAEPKAPNSCKDKIFAGWTTINGYSHPTNQPNDLFSCDEATNKTIPVDGITYNAVFATEITEETTTTISKTKIEDFEKQTAGSVYNSTQTYTAANSNAGIAWKMYYGTVSTNAYLSGSKSAQMRWYDSDPENLPYIESLTKVAKLKSISYSVITSDADYKYSVSYSTNGTSWTAVAANQSASTTKQTKTHTINANGVDAFIKIAITSTTNVSDKATFRIDDVVFTYLESTTTTTTTYSDYVTSCIPTYTITWKNDDGTELKKDYVEHGVVPSYDGEEPTKAATAQYTYTFNGWTPEIVAATEDATYTATYIATTNTYTITWKDWDGTVLETDNKVPYGTTPTYNGKAPNRPEDNTYKHTFAGWDPEVKNVDGDQVYTAKYTQEKHQITITWMVNGEEYTLGDPSATVSAGEKVAKLPNPPSPDDYCGQVFAGWTDKPIEGEPITDAPAILFKTSGSSPTLYKEGDKTTIIFYAVFADYKE